MLLLLHEKVKNYVKQKLRNKSYGLELPSTTAILVILRCSMKNEMISSSWGQRSHCNLSNGYLLVQFGLLELEIWSKQYKLRKLKYLTLSGRIFSLNCVVSQKMVSCPIFNTVPKPSLHLRE